MKPNNKKTINLPYIDLYPASDWSNLPKGTLQSARDKVRNTLGVIEILVRSFDSVRSLEHVSDFETNIVAGLWLTFSQMM